MNVAILWDIAPYSPYVNQHSSEMSLHMWATWYYVPEDDNV
jgi:hypothetical protein